MIFVCLILVAFFILAWKKPVWALGLILALLPTYLIRFTILHLPTTFLELLIVVFLFVVLGYWGLELLRHDKSAKADWQKIKNLGLTNWAAGLFVLAAVIATLVSPEKSKALGQLKAFIIEPVLLFYAALLLIKTEPDRKLVLRCLFGAGVLISLMGILQYATYWGLPIRFWGTGAEVERIVSVFDYPNALALYLAPLFILFFTLALNNYKLIKSRALEMIGLILIGSNVVLTFSRGAWVAVLAVSLIVLLKKYHWKKILAPTFVILIVLLLLPPVRARLLLGLSDPSSSAHWGLIKVSINKILTSPIVGNGLYGFRTTLAQAHYSGEILNYPHNIFLNFWLELGLLGLIAFAWILFLASEQLKKHPSLIRFAAGMFLLTLIIHGMVDVPYFKNDLSILFWFAVSLFYV